MREILFRGKRTDNGEWVCSGNLIHFNEGNECYIPVKNSNCTCTHDINDNIIEWNEVMFCKVIPETVGQYTGLKDKTGKRIFEGDIVKAADTDDADLVGEIVLNMCSRLVSGSNWSDTLFRANEVHALEVIGNIHDNPELLAEVEG